MKPRSHVLIPDFLPAADAATLFDNAYSGDWTIGTSGNGIIDRLSRSVFNAELSAREREWWLPRVLAALPRTARELGVDVSAAPDFFTAWACHHSGGLHVRHRDAGETAMAFWDNRRIAYVYYLHRRPRAFTGGDLVLHPPGADPVRIRPAHNAFVAFPPETEHEVEPVRCDPDDWGAGRFSIVGFVLEPEPPAEG